jgi:hypothetical protein
MGKQSNSTWMNVFIFSTNLILYSLPVWFGFAIYNKYGADSIAAFTLLIYLLYLGEHMTKVVKEIIRNESE